MKRRIIEEMNYGELKEYTYEVLDALLSKAFEIGYEKGYANHQKKIKVQEGRNPLTKTDRK